MAATTPAASRRQKGQKKQQRRDSPSQSMDPSSNELPANEQSAAGAGVENDDCAEPTSFGSSVVGGRSFALRYVARQSARWHPLLVLGVALYSFSDHHALHGKLVYDDKATIQFNQIVQGMAPISDVFYYDYWGKDLLASNESHKSFRPVTTLSFRLDNFIGGGSTYPFHVTNVIAHAVTSCLLYACGRVIFQSAGVVLLASLFFATHPVHSESVSNITGRADVLQSLFYFAGFICYVAAARGGLTSTAHHAPATTATFRGWLAGLLFVFGFLACFILSLFSKENGITLPIVCVFWDFFVWSRLSDQHLCDVFLPCLVKFERTRHNAWLWHIACTHNSDDGSAPTVFDKSVENRYRKTLKEFRVRFWLSAVCAAGLAIFRLWLNGESGPAFSYEQNPMALHDDWVVRTLSIPWVHVHYMYTLVFPMTLSADWSYDTIPLIKTVGDNRVAAWFLAYAMLSLAVRYGFFTVQRQIKLRRQGEVKKLPSKSSNVTDSNSGVAVPPETEHESADVTSIRAMYCWQRELGMGLVLLIVPFLLSSNLFFPVGTIKAERILYLPSAGFCFLQALGVFGTVHAFQELLGAHVRRRYGHMALLVGLGIVAWYGQRCYHRNWEWRSGHDIWKGVVELNPSNPHAVHNYGLELSWAGRQSAAIRLLARSVELNPTNVGNLHPLALALRLDGRCDDAVSIAHHGLHMAWEKIGEPQMQVSMARLMCVIAYCQFPLQEINNFYLASAAYALALDMGREDPVTIGHVNELFHQIQHLQENLPHSQSAITRHAIDLQTIMSSKWKPQTNITQIIEQLADGFDDDDAMP